ncbi:MAG: hypothetical protein M3N18_05770 [Actinomycetota bacterium]|nr:hypothetical protein [Actinomycetota bacterium]
MIAEYERLPHGSLLFERGELCPVCWNERTLNETEERGYIRATRRSGSSRTHTTRTKTGGKGGFAATMKAIETSNVEELVEEQRVVAPEAKTGDDATGNSPPSGPPFFGRGASLGVYRWG